MSFLNKIVLVTGASSGIGAVTAIRFAKEGAKVVINGRNEEKLRTVASKIESIGKKPLVIKADVSKGDEAERLIKQTIDHFKKLEVLVNNAGVAPLGSILDGKILDAYDKTVNINLRAIIHLTTLAAPHLIATKGNIVNISSITSLQVLSYINFLPYLVSKAALDLFTRGAALELAPSGVRVNSVNPGPVRRDSLENSTIDTSPSSDDVQKMTALNRISEPEEIADLILFLASDKARSITGSLFISDNGASLM